MTDPTLFKRLAPLVHRGDVETVRALLSQDPSFLQEAAIKQNNGRFFLCSAAENNAPQTKIRVADLEMDLLSRSVTRAGKEIQLTAREFKLLEFLMRHADQVVTRTMLLEGVWDLQFDPQTNLIDVHMSRLRQAVDKGFARPLIHTVRGAGYVIRDEDKSA